MKSIVCVEAYRKQGDKPASDSRRFYRSSLDDPTAEQVARAVRAHGGIENAMHRGLVVSFREDPSQVRAGNAAENLALVRRNARNRLKQETTAEVGIKTKRLIAGCDHDYLLEVLALSMRSRCYSPPASAAAAAGLTISRV